MAYKEYLVVAWHLGSPGVSGTMIASIRGGILWCEPLKRSETLASGAAVLRLQSHLMKIVGSPGSPHTRVIFQFSRRDRQQGVPLSGSGSLLQTIRLSLQLAMLRLVCRRNLKCKWSVRSEFRKTSSRLSSPLLVRSCSLLPKLASPAWCLPTYCCADVDLETVKANSDLIRFGLRSFAEIISSGFCSRVIVKSSSS